MERPRQGIYASGKGKIPAVVADQVTSSAVTRSRSGAARRLCIQCARAHGLAYQGLDHAFGVLFSHSDEGHAVAQADVADVAGGDPSDVHDEALHVLGAQAVATAHVEEDV